MRHNKFPFINSSRLALQLGCVVFFASLTACSNEDFSDIDRFVREVKARPKGQIVPLPDINVVEPFIFKPEGLRDPFKPMEQPDQSQALDTSKGNGLRPDFNRRKEELEAFPLDGLKMVGTIIMKSRLWALIKASDNTLHRVQVGNYMGKNYGKIIRIGADKIELMEIVPDRPGTWREQQTTLALVE